MKMLIFEPNSYHFEILPGYAKIFSELGYVVTVLVRKHPNLGDEFSLCKNEFEIRQYEGNCFSALKQELNGQSYEFMFVSSFDYGEDGKLININQKFKEYGISIPYFGCYHDFRNLQKNHDESLIEENRVSFLSSYNESCKMINPNYFGSNVAFQREKNRKVIFISIGQSNSRKDIEHAVDTIGRETNDFEVQFVGGLKGVYKSYIKRTLFYPICKIMRIKPYSQAINKPVGIFRMKNISNCGKLKFEDMYNKIERADFIIINLKSGEDIEFPKNCTSGAKQLSLGFNKPCIISREVARYYGFNQANAILYEENLSDGLSAAVKMSDSEYEKMKKELDLMRIKINEISKNNAEQLVCRITQKEVCN